MSRRLPLICLSLLALCACQPEVSGGEPAAAPSAAAVSSVPEPVSAPVLGGIDLSQPVSVNGTEPFWGLQIAAGDIVYSTPEDQGRHFAGAAFALKGNAASLTSGALSVTLSDKSCSDGMSDRVYPLTAEATIDGKTLKGCAISTAEMTAGGQGGED